MSHTKGLLVLVIDDRKSNRDALKMVLEDLGCTVITAEDGEKGIEVFGINSEIKLVITDHQMPKKDGIAVTKAVKQLRPEVKVIAVTVNKYETAGEFTKAGANVVLGKPLDDEQLRVVIEAWFPNPRHTINA